MEDYFRASGMQICTEGEKEMLGIVYGCKIFHNYIYGLHSIEEMDHKPFIAILTNSLEDVPPHIQRMLFRLYKNDL